MTDPAANATPATEQVTPETSARRGSPDPAVPPTAGLLELPQPGNVPETCGQEDGGVERPAPSAELPQPGNVPETCGQEDGGVGRPAPSAASAAAKPGHGPGGRFVVGNPGGPGNPYARETARLRQEFRDCAKPGDMLRVYTAIMEAALKGNTAAMRLYTQYRIGQPLKQEDPDAVVAHELELLKQTSVNKQELAQVTQAADGDSIVQIARVMRPLNGSILREKIGDLFRHPEKYEPEIQDIAMLDQPAPFPNGPIGDALKENIQGAHKPKARRSPSPNRPSGASRTQPPPIDNGPNGPDQAAQVSVFGSTPSPNGKKRPEHASGR